MQSPQQSLHLMLLKPSMFDSRTLWLTYWRKLALLLPVVFGKITLFFAGGSCGRSTTSDYSTGGGGPAGIWPANSFADGTN